MIKDIKNYYEKAFEGIQDIIFLIKVLDDNFFEYIVSNKAHQKSTGIPLEDIKGKTPMQLFGEELGKKIENNCKKCVLIKKTINYEEILTSKSPEKYYNTSLSPIIEDDKVSYIVGISRDITSIKKDKEKIIKMKERLENIIEGTNVGTWEWNIQTGETIFNDRWIEMLGYSLEELSPVNIEKWQNLKIWAEMMGYTLEETSPVNIETWKKLTHPDDLKKSEEKLKKVMNKKLDCYDFELRMKHKNGKWIWINSRAKVTKWSGDGKALLMSGTHTDITEKREKQKQIEYLSFHDNLTGLYNRRYMEDSIRRLDTSRNIPFSIIYADINGLKLINDAYGHEMGDKLLVTAAEILKNSFRQEDIICRVGGDEFVILLPKIGKEKVNEIIERIKKESKKTKLDSVIVSLALGYSTKDKKEKNIFEVYKEADNQMYKNKLKHGQIMRNETIKKVLLNINKKYDNEKLHTERVSQYCESIAKVMNLTNKEVEYVKIAGLLHDIGKIVVPPEILNKKDKLTEKDWEKVKKHSSSSYQLLKSVDEYTQVSEAVLYHHEKLDGSGYPEGLKDGEIPLLSKIIAVADAYEAMTADRPYKNKRTKEEAVKELEKYSGTQFDKDIVEVFTNKVL